MFDVGLVRYTYCLLINYESIVYINYYYLIITTFFFILTMIYMFRYKIYSLLIYIVTAEIFIKNQFYFHQLFLSVS